MAHGTIKIVLAEKGFGFITDTSGVDWFFHSSGVANHNFDGLREGQSVTFDESSGAKGPRAERVQLA